ncbi:MAG TPA: hypothetical protein VIN32_06140 [Candidatus Limnocylindria bacterium]
MPDLLARVAVRTIVFAVVIGLMAPLSARSATPASAESMRLLAVADQPLSLADRSSLDGRNRSASLSLSGVSQPIGTEDLGLAPAPATPPTIAMEASLYPAPAKKVAPKSVAAPVSGDTVSGEATWYCCSAGWRGQAVVALPGALGGHYDAPPAARFVTVCADRCAVLPVADYCGCLWGTADQKVADLSPEAWAAISDSSTSRGVITVTVHLGG